MVVRAAYIQYSRGVPDSSAGSLAYFERMADGYAFRRDDNELIVRVAGCFLVCSNFGRASLETRLETAHIGDHSGK